MGVLFTLLLRLTVFVIIHFYLELLSVLGRYAPAYIASP
jgi:hypothetical protein